MKELKNTAKFFERPVPHGILMFVVLTFSSVVFAVNLNFFVNVGGLFPAGFSGVSILIQKIVFTFTGFEIPYSLLYLPLNIIPVVIGFKFIGRQFTVWSLYVVVASSLLTDLIPAHVVTEDVLLIAVFGGIISGGSTVLVLIMGAGTGGTDFISIYFSEKKGVDTWNYVLAFNVCILIAAGLLFGLDKALYSIIYQFVSTQVLNTVYRRYQKDTLLIVSDKSMEIYHKIDELTNHAATLIEGRGCYEEERRQILYSVVGRGEVAIVVAAIHDIDPKAFVNIIHTHSIRGNFYRKPTK